MLSAGAAGYRSANALDRVVAMSDFWQAHGPAPKRRSGKWPPPFGCAMPLTAYY